MATIRSEIKTAARAEDVWLAVRDVGALHTRLVPGFVTDTKLEARARVVTFANGVTLHEPIVTIDNEARRLVWTHEGGRAKHYNGALQVSALPDGSTSVTWTADFLPDDIHGYFSQAIAAGMAAMRRTLDALAREDATETAAVSQGDDARTTPLADTRR
jgi:hypothetical protein